MSQRRVWAVIVAAGSGDRFGGPKQLAPLGDTRVIDHSVAVAEAATDGVVVVAAPEEFEQVTASLPGVVCATGGATRSASVRAGLASVPANAEVIVVHDGARPLASAALFDRVVAAVTDGADAAVPVVAVTDTIRHGRDGVVDRADLWAVQTPQGFRADALRSAHAGGGDATDDAALVEADGGKVVLVNGESTNLKITHAHDLRVARALLAEDR